MSNLCSSGCEWFFVCPFIFLHVALSLLRFQTSVDMSLLSQLACFVMQRFLAANFEKYGCSINVAYTAGRRGCLGAKAKRPPCLCKKQQTRRGRVGTEYAGKVCVQFNDKWATFSREFAKVVLMFGCCGSSFSANFYFISCGTWTHTHDNVLLLH